MQLMMNLGEGPKGALCLYSQEMPATLGLCPKGKWDKHHAGCVALRRLPLYSLATLSGGGPLCGQSPLASTEAREVAPGVHSPLLYSLRSQVLKDQRLAKGHVLPRTILARA